MSNLGQQLMLLPGDASGPSSRPSVRVRAELSDDERRLVSQANLGAHGVVQAWLIDATNRQLQYATHGIFRFFGKFPPPIADHLIRNYSAPGDVVLDPMVGSGTSAVEALRLGRRVVAADVSPLSVLLTRVKTTPIEGSEALDALDRVREMYDSGFLSELPSPVGLRNPEHWFLPATLRQLGILRAAIDAENRGPVHDLLTVAFASAVRRASKATTEQGRLFLDVATALPDPWEVFQARYASAAKAVGTLPLDWLGKAVVSAQSAMTPPVGGNRIADSAPVLCIIHPPYFNNYRYSRVNSLELAWLGVDQTTVRRDEVREFFKTGGAANVEVYVDDIIEVLRIAADEIAPGGTIALMIGDSTFRGEYLRITDLLLSRVYHLGLRVDLMALRVPRFTEASWVASQRRTGGKVGVRLYDFVIVLRKQ